MRYPVYFKALETERTIAAHDARLDPRTSAFTSLVPRPVRRHLDARRPDPPPRTASPAWSASSTPARRAPGRPRTSTSRARSRTSWPWPSTRAIAGRRRRRCATASSSRSSSPASPRASRTRPTRRSTARSSEALGDIGMFVGAERCHVLILDDDGLSGRMTHEWSAPGRRPRASATASSRRRRFRGGSNACSAATRSSFAHARRAAAARR